MYRSLATQSCYSFLASVELTSNHIASNTNKAGLMIGYTMTACNKQTLADTQYFA